MPDLIRCRRCGEESRPLPRAPIPGPLGSVLLDQTCPACWSEWERAEVMVINELRLNFMEPKAQDVLAGHMREFLFLDPPGDS